MTTSSMSQLHADQFGGSSIQAGHANRRGTTLLISRPRDFWPWLTHRRDSGERKRGTGLLAVASALLLAEAIAQGYVSWFAQYRFVLAAKHAVLASGLEAIGLDTSAVIFALLALAAAVRGRRALIGRVLNVLCALSSLGMNVLGAHMGSPRSIAIYALPSLLYATTSDRLIAEVREHYRPEDKREQRSPWETVVKVPLYILRFFLAMSATWAGMRQAVLNATPLPEIEAGDGGQKHDGDIGREADGGRAQDRRPERRRDGDRKRQRRSGPSKKSVLLDLYAKHEGHGDPARISRIAAELAPQAGLQAGTARTYLYDHVRGNAAVADEPADGHAQVA